MITRSKWVFFSRVALVVGLVTAAASARVIVSGEEEIALSTSALRVGDVHGAAVHARRAAGWYAPGAPHVRVAYERLVALAAAAEGHGDLETALLAWRGVRTAATETRWLVTPHAHHLEQANAAIARLAEASPRPPGTRTDPPGTLERKQAAALGENESPRAGWIAALVLAFAAWLGGSVWAVRAGVTVTGELVRRRAMPGLFVALAGLALWLLAVWRA